MKKRLSILQFVVILFVAVALTFVGTSSYYSDTRTSAIANAVKNEKAIYEAQINDYKNALKHFEKLLTIDKRISEKYIGDVDWNKVVDTAVRGAFVGLGDKYSIYYSAEEMKANKESASDTHFGLGVNVAIDENFRLYVTNVVTGSEADNAGVKRGDRIIQIGEFVLSGETYADAISVVSTGEEGSEYEMVIERMPDYKTKETLTLKRMRFKNQTIINDMFDKICYICITGFDDNTDEDFILAVDEAVESGAESFIFDVRDNPGGSLDTIVEILDRLLPEGPIVRFEDSSGNTSQKNSDKERFITQSSVVLTNSSTASAAELFASALKDYNQKGLMKSTIIGFTTFGKGTMQTFSSFEDGSAFKLTENKYNPPFSENYSGVGVLPDIQSKADPGNKLYRINYKDDLQLNEAIKYLKGSTTNG